MSDLGGLDDEVDRSGRHRRRRQQLQRGRHRLHQGNRRVQDRPAAAHHPQGGSDDLVHGQGLGSADLERGVLGRRRLESVGCQGADVVHEDRGHELAAVADLRDERQPPRHAQEPV